MPSLKQKWSVTLKPLLQQGQRSQTRKQSFDPSHRLNQGGARDTAARLLARCLCLEVTFGRLKALVLTADILRCVGARVAINAIEVQHHYTPMLPTWNRQVTSAVHIHVVQPCNGDDVALIKSHRIIAFRIKAPMKRDTVTLLVSDGLRAGPWNSPNYRRARANLNAVDEHGATDGACVLVEVASVQRSRAKATLIEVTRLVHLELLRGIADGIVAVLVNLGR